MTEADPPGMLTVRDAADEVGRTPETVRRWVWSGRLRATKRGNRLMVARDDLERVAGTGSRADLAAWLDQLAAQRSRGWHAQTRSAADLILTDRRRRSSTEAPFAGR